jgi:hypothetical protein
MMYYVRSSAKRRRKFGARNEKYVEEPPQIVDDAPGLVANESEPTRRLSQKRRAK